MKNKIDPKDHFESEPSKPRRSKITVIGIGGRTGTMFAAELKNVANVLGVGVAKDVDMVNGKNLFIERNEGAPELFEEKVIEDLQFSEDDVPDFLFLAIRNPIGAAVKYYYQKARDKGLPFPVLVISQNGIDCIEESLRVLKEVFREDMQQIKIIRVSLFNPIDKRESDGKTYIKYSQPIRISFGKVTGMGDIQDIAAIFAAAGFEAKEFDPKNVKNMEFSKLFLNLIGMASASRGISVNQGFNNEEVFKEEIGAMTEYIKAVLASGGNFINLPGYPVALFSFLISFVPIKILLLFRGYISNFISRGREDKPKDLDEVNYYNGAVIKLGKIYKIETPINQDICVRTGGEGCLSG